MSFSKKIVGNLIFNQNDGEIKHKKTEEYLAKYPVKFAIPIHLLATAESVAIDSTGTKLHTGDFTLTSEMIKHLKEAYLEVDAGTPSATDAVVEVQLYNETDGASITAVTYSGEGGHKISADIASTLKTLAGKVLSAHIEVTTTSGTSEATQIFRSIVLRLVYDFT